MALCYLRRQPFHVVEETTTSIFVRYCSCLGELLFPAINVIDCVTVSEFDNFFVQVVYVIVFGALKLWPELDHGFP